MGWPRQRFKGRGAAGGGRRPTSFFSRVWVSSRVLVEREGRGVLPWYKLSRSRGGIYIDRPSCRSYLEGVISTTTRQRRERKIIKEKEEKRKKEEGRRRRKKEEKKEEKKKGIEEKKKK